MPPAGLPLGLFAVLPSSAESWIAAPIVTDSLALVEIVGWIGLTVSVSPVSLQAPETPRVLGRSPL